jgi:hypothetical protein
MCPICPPAQAGSGAREAITMIRKTLSTIFVLVILLFNSGCELKTSTSSTAFTPSEVTSNPVEQATTTPNLDENAIIAILAGKNKQDPTKYELHDVKISGDYVIGSWSFEGNLSPERFWAFRANSSWRLVYLGKDTPACDQLKTWPAEVKVGCRDDLNAKQISNFSQCVTAGGKIENTKPRRCLDGVGNIFVEMLASTIDKRYISQDLNKCPALDFDCNTSEKRFMDGQGCGCQNNGG